jgi:hypothetical protein
MARGRTFSGRPDYVMHVPVGQLAPNDAFWSLTMGKASLFLRRAMKFRLNRETASTCLEIETSSSAR